MSSRKFLKLLASLALAANMIGCGDPDQAGMDDDHDHGHDHTHDHGHSHGHHHEPPHGGVGVVLGAEEFHLELVMDSAAGQLSIYVLDGHMEEFIRIPDSSITLDIETGSGVKSVTFHAEASTRTGETVGNTSWFVARDEMFKDLKNFQATLPNLTIRNKTYTQVKFSFPEGNE